MKIRILCSATQDLLEGYKFYENQAEGVGSYFIDSLNSDIDSLVVTAGIHPISFGKYQRLLSKRFPFAVYYELENNIASVYAVLDCRKNPAWIRMKLGCN